MAFILGIDTSNYTSSVSIYNTQSGEIAMKKRLLPVKENSLGLRQSDAVFEHIKQLHTLVEELFCANPCTLSAVCVSTRPRTVEGSYMPAFLVGDMLASSIASVLRIPKFCCSHQDGHIAAALYGANRLDMLNAPFYAFHLSGGTTEVVRVTPTKCLFEVEIIAQTLDLNAGQLVDRVGVMLGLRFPCGGEITELSLQCGDKIQTKPTLKGCNIHLSGVQNQCEKLLTDGKTPSYIAKYVIEYLKQAVEDMTNAIFLEYGKLPVLYAGGVMSNITIKEHIENKFGGIFSPPIYSADNSAGVSVIGAIYLNQ